MAVGRRAAADHRPGDRLARGAARVRRPARRPRPRRAGLRHRLHARRGAPGADRGGGRAVDFPLVEIPYDTPFIAVTEKAFARLVNEQYALLQRSIAVQERLQRIVLSERGLDAIAAALATLIGGTTVIFDGRGEPQALHAFRRELPEDALTLDRLRAARARARRTEARGFVPSHAELAAARAGAAGRGRRDRPACRRPGWSPSRTPAACRSSTASCCTRRSRSWRSSSCAATSPRRPSAAWPATCSPSW